MLHPQYFSYYYYYAAMGLIPALWARSSSSLVLQRKPCESRMKTVTMDHPPLGNTPLWVTQNNRPPYKTHQLQLYRTQSILKLFTSSRLLYIEKCLGFIFSRCFILWPVATPHWQITSQPPNFHTISCSSSTTSSFSQPSQFNRNGPKTASKAVYGGRYGKCYI